MLNLKVPPLILMLLLLVVLLILNQNPDYKSANEVSRVIGSGMLGVGIILIFSAAFSFRRHRTTVDPVNIENTNKLVTSGVFALSRNPMYLAMAAILFGAGAYIGAIVVGVVVTAIFVLYISQYQIKPEERMLRRKFGEEYKTYCNKVRRWI